MRSRTEMVTTTFVDSQEEESEEDDSEEDWKPSSEATRSNGGGGRSAKRQGKTKNRSRKRKLSVSGGSGGRSQHPTTKRRTSEANYRDWDDTDDDEFDELDFASASNSPTPVATQPGSINNRPTTAAATAGPARLPVERNIPNRSGIFNLYVYKKDLDEDYKTNGRLCLWRRDGVGLLQKYIRVKTASDEELIFTSSSVYSSWDENRRNDFEVISVKCLEENNRRVTVLNSSDMHNLAMNVLKQRQEDNGCDFSPDDEDAEDDDVDEISGDDEEDEHDIPCAKSDGDDDNDEDDDGEEEDENQDTN